MLISQNTDSFLQSWLYNPIMNLSFNFKVKRRTVNAECVWENTCMQVEAWVCLHTFFHRLFWHVRPLLSFFLCVSFQHWQQSRQDDANRLYQGYFMRRFSGELSPNQNIHSSIDPLPKAVGEIEEAPPRHCLNELSQRKAQVCPEMKKNSVTMWSFSCPWKVRWGFVVHKTFSELHNIKALQLLRNHWSRWGLV